MEHHKILGFDINSYVRARADIFNLKDLDTI